MMFRTTTLYTGDTVIAHDDVRRDVNGEARPKMFSNRTQAYNAAARVTADGWSAEVIRCGRPFYVRINN